MRRSTTSPLRTPTSQRSGLCGFGLGLWLGLGSGLGLWLELWLWLGSGLGLGLGLELGQWLWSGLGSLLFWVAPSPQDNTILMRDLVHHAKVPKFVATYRL